MTDSLLTARQRLVLTALGAVSPLFSRLPEAVADAGGVLWLAPVFSLVPLCLTALLLYGLLRPLAGQGLCPGLCRVMGHGLGRGILFIYSIWAAVLWAGALRSGAQRFCWALFPQSGVTAFLFVMAALALMGALGRLRTLGRMGEVVLPFLLMGLGLIFLPGLAGMEWENLTETSPEKGSAAAMGALSVTNTAACALYAAFLPAEGTGRRREWLSVFGAMGALGFLLCFVTVGRLGAELTGELPYPFFMMLRDFRFLRLLERVEALLCALWVVTDFFAAAILLSAGGRCLSAAITTREGTALWFTLAVAAVGLLGAFIAPAWLWAVIPAGNGILLLGGLTGIYITGRMRRRL